MIMTEEKEKIKLEKNVIINIIDGDGCIYLPPGIITKKLPPPQVIPFRFSTLQEFKTEQTKPYFMDELKKLFNSNNFKISYFELQEPKGDKKDDNEERERETEKGV